MLVSISNSRSRAFRFIFLLAALKSDVEHRRVIAAVHNLRRPRQRGGIDLCRAFWDSWDDDGFAPFDKDSPSALNLAAAHPVRHHGTHFRAEGLLDLPRPIQGHPVLVQAGNSDSGKDFTARFAEIVYCTAPTFEVARDYYRDVKSRMARHGRDPSQLIVTPGLMPVIGRSQQEADDRYGALQDLYDVRNGAKLLGIDLSGYALDEPLPDLPPADNSRGRHEQMIAVARREKLTVRQLIKRFTVVRGHHLVVGTAERVADEIEHWFRQEAADGFNLIPALLPCDLGQFAGEVIPLLRHRGLMPSPPDETSLRARLQLDRPADNRRRRGS